MCAICDFIFWFAVISSTLISIFIVWIGLYILFCGCMMPRDIPQAPPQYPVFRAPWNPEPQKSKIARKPGHSIDCLRRTQVLGQTDGCDCIPQVETEEHRTDSLHITSGDT